MKFVLNRATITLFFVVVLINIIVGDLLIDRIIVVSILLYCIVRGLHEKYWVNPYFLFAFVPLSLSVYFNIADVYMVNLTHRTWALAIINMLSFLTAFSITREVQSKKLCVSIKGKSLVIAAIFFFVIGYLSNYIEQLASILWIFSVPAIVCAIKSKKIIMYVFVIIIILLPLLSGASKTGVLLQLLTIMICLEKYFDLGRKYRKWMPIIGLLAVFFMIFSFTFANKDRGRYDSDEGLSYYEAQGVEWNTSAALFLPYMYLTHAWGNLQYVTETQDTRTYGLWTVKPLLGYLQLDDDYKTEYTLKPYSSFNTFTYIACAFKDYGYWLSIIMSLLLGFYIKKVYSKFIFSRSPLDVATYVCVAMATAEMFFSNHFFMQSYPFTILILMSIIQFLIPKYIECED